MTSTYTQVFGGNTIYPSDVSYLALALTSDITTNWPLDANTDVYVLARIIDVTPAGAYAIRMPDATLTGTGQTVLFNNLGPYTIDIEDYDSNTLASIAQGEQWQLYLYDNSTAAGGWRVFQYGATTAQAQASALAGYGLSATGSTLSQSLPTTTLSSDYTIGAADRAKMYVWTGALGTISLPTSATIGPAFFVSFNNSGEGDVAIVAAGSDTIDGTGTLTLAPSDSVTLSTDGTGAWYTLGFGQQVQSNFDYTSIDLTGETSPYTLSGAELNRVAYDFVGTLIEDFEVIVPSTIQQYWIANDTTGGSYTLSFRTATQSPAVLVTRGQRGIYYCTGSEVVDADTAGISTPIAIVDGGTGATSAGAALINLGGTSTGTGVFTAVSQGAARTVLGSGTVGDQVFVANTQGAAQSALGLTPGTDVQPYNAKLSAFSALTPSANDIAYFTGSSTMAVTATTSYGRSLWSAANAAAAQTTLALVPGTDVQAYSANLAAIAGVVSAANKLFYFTGSGTGAVTDFTSFGRTLVASADASAAQTTLNLVPGTNVQAYSANLAAIAGVTSAANKLFYFTGSGTGAVTDFTSLARSFVATTTGSAAFATLFTPGAADNVVKSDGAGGWVVGSLPSAGDVVGPASATNNAVAQFDGTTGKLLKSGPSIGTSANNLVQLDGSAALPAVSGANLTNLPAGGLTLIATVTASNSATVDIEGYFDSTYDEYLLLADGIYPTANAALQMLLKVGGSYQTSGYIFAYSYQDSNSTSETFATATTEMPLSATWNLTSGFEGAVEARFIRPASSSTAKMFWVRSFQPSNSYVTKYEGFGKYGTSTQAAITGVRFLFSSGNVSTGTFRLYGFKK